jgi:hypothetical protein
VASGARGAELDGFAGILRQATGDDQPTTSAVEYRQSFTDHLAASFIWLNEGHLQLHHRDGQALQLWWRTQRGGPGLVFEGGLGPYRMYDGTWHDDGHFPVATHRWGAVASAAADWYFDNDWFAYLRLNRVEAINDFNSTALVAGVGYSFADRLGAAPFGYDGAGAGGAPRWEFDFLLGPRVPNTHPSPQDKSDAFGLRAAIDDHVAASVTFLDVRGTTLDWHTGTATQLWLEQHLNPSLTVGAGLGALFTTVPAVPANFNPAVSQISVQSSSLPFLVTAVTAAYTAAPRWLVRLVWDRVAGRFQDCDIYLAGVGYAF